VDPWLRVHEELGGRPTGIARRAVTVRGSVGDWERWTGQRFRTSGKHAVPGALVPVVIRSPRGRRGVRGAQRLVFSPGPRGGERRR
jgi:hypothetical protein